MKKQITCALVCLTLLLGLSAPAYAAEEPATASVTVNGTLAEDFQATIYGSTSYLSFCAGTMALRPDASITWEDGQFIATASDFTMTVRVGDSHLVINGRYLYIPDGVKGLEDGTALVPARTLATALGAWIGWGDGVELCSGGVPLTAEGRPYDDATLDLLSRVITHESGNQPLRGKIAVGNVIINRVNHPGYPGTVAEVLAVPGQFPGASSAAANTESILAARLALEGANVVPGAYWFNGAGKDCWAARNRTLVAVIGGHAFYG